MLLSIKNGKRVKNKFRAPFSLIEAKCVDQFLSPETQFAVFTHFFRLFSLFARGMME